MLVEFKKLIIHNYLSIAHAEVDLNNQGVVIIKGQNNFDSSTNSNGSGKSSIFSAFNYVLTGESPEGISQVKSLKNYITSEAEDMQVEVLFSINQENYSITRGCTGDYKPIFVIKEEGKVISSRLKKETEVILSSVLPKLITESRLLNNLCLFNQNMPNKFTSLEQSQKKLLIEKLFDIELIIENLKISTTERLNHFSDCITNCNLDIREYNSKKELLTKQLINNKTKLSNLTFLTCEDLDLIQEKVSICEENFQDISNEITKLNETVQETSLKLNNLEQQKETSILKIKQEQEEVQKPLNIELNTLVGELKQLNAQRKELEKTHEYCPTCKQKLPNYTSLRLRLNEVTELIDKRTEDKNKIEKELTESRIKFADKINKATINITIEINSLTAELSEVKNTLQSKIKEKEIISKQLENLKLDYNSENITLQHQEEVRLELENSISSITQELEEIDNKLTSLNSNLTIYTKKCEIDNKILQLVKKQYRTYLLELIIKSIDKNLKNICSLIYNSTNISVGIGANNSDIEIVFNNVVYELLSGGEQRKVDLLFQLALKETLEKLSGIYINLLVFDEPFDALDTTAVTPILNLLYSKAETISSIFIISHRIDELEITGDKTLLVTKDINRLSRVTQL